MITSFDLKLKIQEVVGKCFSQKQQQKLLRNESNCELFKECSYNFVANRSKSNDLHS